MAGMEQLEIHSKSYLVRWVNVSEGHTISWSLQPQRKSINFGIFKHPGTTNGATPSLPIMLDYTQSPLYTGGQDTDAASGQTGSCPPSLSRRNSTITISVTEKLKKLGMKQVAWAGKCDSDRVSVGKYNVPMGESGMYGLVFDNTHSKSFAKTVTFVLMTYPSNAPPKSGHHLRFTMTRKTSNSTIGKTSPMLLPASDSNDNLLENLNTTKIMLADTRPNPDRTLGSDVGDGLSFYTGVLFKKRRKRNQGYARRFFSLDYTTSTLSYYKNRNSSALRGAIPLSLAAIGANEKERHISIDSGAEIWFLRAHNQKDFIAWKDALQQASQNAATAPTPAVRGHARSWSRSAPLEDREWGAVENLVGRVAGITDAVRRLAKDTDPKYFSQTTCPNRNRSECGTNLTTISRVEQDGGDNFVTEDAVGQRSSFWKRSPSHSGQSASGSGFRRNLKGSGSSLAIPSPTEASFTSTGRRQTYIAPQPQDEQFHERCMAVFHDLDGVVAQFSALIAESRQRRLPERVVTARNSLDSSWSQEFFDAEDGIANTRILDIDRDSEAETSPERDNESDTSTSEIEVSDAFSRSHTSQQPGQPRLFPARPKTLRPLPHPPVLRRTTIHPSSGPPPSMISFLRKNAGKDLSTISMPVTANEPVSLLQRQSEQMEYSSLLDSAAASTNAEERILHIAAFAISVLSTSRLKERATRKPFNPMLGETFELVREDMGYRFLAEKVSHRPVRIACQAESQKWTFTHAPSPRQKFWGKSAELITDGRARVVLHPSSTSPGTGTGDNEGISEHRYSWMPATCFLRNIIGGDKYVEPVSSMTVVDETSTSGLKAVVTFKAGGMFSGRSEDVTVAIHDGPGTTLSLGLIGKWTSHLDFTGDDVPGKRLWTVGETVPNAATRYGMTSFAATLNEITPVEAGALPPTDSRLRPDQRAYEDGDVEEAEVLKVKLEEAQRRRRKEMEIAGEVWRPRWFECVALEGERHGVEEEVWVLKVAEAERGYWDVREGVVCTGAGREGRWEGVRKVFELQ